MTAAPGAALVAAAYLLGSVPFGVLVGRFWTGVDPRSVGSGNIGASNVARSAGKAAGIVTLLLDAAKAALPMLLGRALLVRLGAGPAAAEAWSVAVGLAAFAGHLWPIWLRF
ncbi:MAG TPA: glycerol-3-phosphate acyltransferase, partial [Anaeromyxobacteraceae bacterium]|nr:glycerol-3-phosphate acyltransferase [Anaeromyxobacteraceae bacterium]